MVALEIVKHLSGTAARRPEGCTGRGRLPKDEARAAAAARSACRGGAAAGQESRINNQWAWCECMKKLYVLEWSGGGWWVSGFKAARSRSAGARACPRRVMRSRRDDAPACDRALARLRRIQTQPHSCQLMLSSLAFQWGCLCAWEGLVLVGGQPSIAAPLKAVVQRQRRARTEGAPSQCPPCAAVDPSTMYPEPPLSYSMYLIYFVTY